jgi:hypothetical protein
LLSPLFERDLGFCQLCGAFLVARVHPDCLFKPTPFVIKPHIELAIATVGRPSLVPKSPSTSFILLHSIFSILAPAASLHRVSPNSDPAGDD